MTFLDFTWFDRTEAMLKALSAKLDQLLVLCASLNPKLDQLIAQGVSRMAIDAATQASIDALNTAVAAETTIETSVETLLTGLAAQIAALKAGQTNPAVIAALDAATAIVVADNAKTSAAVVANTPAS